MMELAAGMTTMAIIGLLAGSAMAWNCFDRENGRRRMEYAFACSKYTGENQEACNNLLKEIVEQKELMSMKAEAAGVAGPLAGRGYGYGHYGRGFRAGGGYCRR
ncbi:hypothetical protein [Desulfatibacillum aliphaticivorans]|uniref:hypothetical protein n=1 Tax=Desulfatibacillum aliphaticivorans TaxID=218208 RepID=UPI000422C996|nr:hypothetical protein [Desulfatibacillum aliphaticivorans]